jgi:acetyl-CoA synthetase
MLINADPSGGPGPLREVTGAGQRLNAEVIEQVFHKCGLTNRDGQGQTETSARVGHAPGDRLRPGSMGRPLPTVPMVLVDPVTSERLDGVGEDEICLDLPSGPRTARTVRPNSNRS